MGYHLTGERTPSKSSPISSVEVTKRNVIVLTEPVQNLDTSGGNSWVVPRRRGEGSRRLARRNEAHSRARAHWRERELVG